MNKTSTLIAIFPVAVAQGVMIKMNHDQTLIEEQTAKTISQLKQESSQSQKIIEDIREIEETCGMGYNECLSKVASQKKVLKQELDSLMAEYQALKNKLSESHALNDEISAKNKSLEDQVEKRTHELNVTRKSIDRQLAAELMQLEDKIREIKKSHAQTLKAMERKLAETKAEYENKVALKEEEFKTAYRNSVNHLVGMVDSLAQDSPSGLIPLVSLYSDKKLVNDFICNESEDYAPEDLIFSKHMQRHWMIWPVTVVENTTHQLTATTASGYEIHAEWDNPENVYELKKNDNVTIQFQLDGEQECGTPLTTRRTVFTTS